MAYIKAMQLNGEEMTYDTPNYAWVKVITTTADNTPINIVATGAEYSKATATDDAAAVVKTMNYTLADGKMTDAATAGSVNIAKAGTYTITVKVGESDGVYTCKYKPSAWENFRFIFVGENKDDKQTWYGSDPSDLFKLSTASDCWNIWFKDDVTGGEVTVTADINAMTWKYE